MTIYNLGSINIDHVYRVPKLPAPGETLAANSLQSGLGGKGANQSVAASLAGALVCHIGAIGTDGEWAIAPMISAGVNLNAVARLDLPTGHAIIIVDDCAENAIVLHAGANVLQSEAMITAALSDAKPGDILMLQNETNMQVFAATHAGNNGLRVVYSAAPFDVSAVRAILPFVSLIVVNEIEAKQLCDALATTLDLIPVPEVLVTKGSKGADWYRKGMPILSVNAYIVEAVDTTGAGDCFIGSLCGATDQGLSPLDAIQYASAAAAISVTRAGAAQSMPNASQVQAFLQEHN